MTSNAYSIAKKTVRLAVCAAMLALPLGPFSLSDVLSTAFAGSASGTQVAAEQDEQQGWAYEYPLNSRVALNQPLGVSAKLAAAQPESGSSATQDAASYSAILQYETYGIADEYNTLASTDAVVEGDHYVVRFDNTVVPATDTANNGWAKPQQTRFRLIITNTVDGTRTEKDFYLYIEPASQTVAFNGCVAADDIDQPALPVDPIQATYGCAYSYDPSSQSSSSRKLPVPTRPNYDFEGWYTGYNATTGTYSNKVDESSIFTGTAPTTLYAKWAGKRYELILVSDSMVGSNQGHLSQTRLYVNYGDTYKALASVTGTGTTGKNTELRGWTDYFGNPVEPSDKVTDKDVKSRTWATGIQCLYAVWGEARESIDDAVVSGVQESYACTGRPITLDELVVTLPKKTDESGEVVREEKTLKADKDYVVQYANNVDVSTEESKATFTVTGTGKYKGSVMGSFAITTGTPYFEVNDNDITNGQNLTIYWNATGSMVVQNTLTTDAADVTYKLEGDLDAASIDAATGNITLKRPVSNIKVTAVASKGSNFEPTPEGGASYTLTVASKSLASKNVTLSASSFAYNGKKRTPSVTVKNSSGVKLKQGVDYLVDVQGACKKVGTYKVKVTGLCGYCSSVTKSFTVNPKACSKLKAKRYGSQKVSGKKYGLYKLSWGKVSGADGYQVYRAVGSKAAKTTFNAKTTSKAFGWQKGKKVTVKVRAFEKVSGKKYYSAWKKITVKAK